MLSQGLVRCFVIDGGVLNFELPGPIHIVVAIAMSLDFSFGVVGRVL